MKIRWWSYMLCAFLALSAGYVSASQYCSGHRLLGGIRKVRKSWTIRQQPSIHLYATVKIGDGSTHFLREVRQHEYVGLGYACPDTEVDFWVLASDRDEHVCQGSVSGHVYNVILNTDLFVGVKDKFFVERLRIPLTSDAPDAEGWLRHWYPEETWRIPADFTDEMYLQFNGTVADMECPDHPQSVDANVCLSAYHAKLTIPIVRRIQVSQDGRACANSVDNDGAENPGMAWKRQSVMFDAFNHLPALGNTQNFPGDMPKWSFQRIPFGQSGAGQPPEPSVAMGTCAALNYSFDTPGLYRIQAETCVSQSHVFLIVFDVTMNVEKTLLTLKHDRECNLEVTVEPSGMSAADEYRIDIKRAGEGTWHTLATSKTISPWQGNVAGVFHIRGIAKFNGTEYSSENVIVTNQFPSYSQIVGDPAVRGYADAAWARTLADCTETPNRRREHGFWVLLNTGINAYQRSDDRVGRWTPPRPLVGRGASVRPMPRPRDTPVHPAPHADGVIYTVAFFHTHTPTTYLADYYEDGSTRRVGPSPPDNDFHSRQKVPGIVYDYIESSPGSKRIPLGHPKEAPAKLYYSAGLERRPTP